MISTYLYYVQLAIVHPVPAREGDIIAVRPGHATHPIVVTREVNGRCVMVAVGPPNYGAILGHVECDVPALIQIFSSAASMPLAAHPAVRSA